MPIPRITHQTAASARLPGPHETYRRTLLSLHPSWEHRFYDDAACRALVASEMPDLLGLYDGYPTAIQRADLFRVLAVYLAGGFYLDLDVACHRPLDSLCRHGCVVAEESTLDAEALRRLGHRHALRVANYMFGSEPRHPFWLEVLAEMVERSERLIGSEEDVLESTGPGLFTEVYHRGAGRLPGVILLRNHGVRCLRCGGVSCQFGAFAGHRHEGTWRWQHARGRQPSPAKGADAGRPPVDRRRVREVLDRERRRNGAGHDDVYVLRTYTEDAHDGLTSVFHRVKGLGRVVDDSRHLRGKRVLVPGIPFLYADRLSPRNANVAYTTFESTRLPGHWVEALNARYNRCAVPHPCVERTFRSSGVRIPLQAIQQGYTRHPKPPGSAPRDGAFRVGFLGVPVQRKNLERLLRACLDLHPEIPSLRLAIHVSRRYDWLDPAALEPFRRSPIVEWSEGRLSDAELGAWYGRLSCYAFPSAAEGWSFTPRESLYLAIPTLVSDIPAHRELAAGGYCTLIPARGCEPAATEWGVFGEWSHVRVEDVRRALAEVYEDRDRAAERARAGSRWIAGRWRNEDVEADLRRLLDTV